MAGTVTPWQGCRSPGRAGDLAACPQAELSRHFRQSQQHPRRLEEALRPRSISEEQRELLALLRCLHRPELEMPEPRSHTLLEGGLRHPPSVTAQRFDHHRALCARIIRQQQQLIAGASLP